APQRVGDRRTTSLGGVRAAVLTPEQAVAGSGECDEPRRLGVAALGTAGIRLGEEVVGGQRIGEVGVIRAVAGLGVGRLIVGHRAGPPGSSAGGVASRLSASRRHSARYRLATTASA